VAVAESVIAEHKSTGPRGYEFRDKAAWWHAPARVRAEPDLFGATLPAPATFPVDGAGAER
jgi:hypothetical protein